MGYVVYIKEQSKSDILKKEIETLKEFRDLLLEYRDKLIEVEMREVKNTLNKHHL